MDTSGLQQCAVSSVALLCDGPEDCEGQVCCANYGSGLPFTGPIQCSPTCLGDMQAMLCHPATGDWCPNGMACKSDPLLDGYFTCQPI